jgi:alcohol dehydrogenase, propanol-preferring
MKAMVLKKIQDLSKFTNPLEYCEVPDPIPQEGELLIQVSVCGVCHTELDEIEGRLPPPELPVILGHQVVGNVIQTPAGSSFQLGDRVGVAWIFSSCGNCEYCQAGLENLCPAFQAAGRDHNGGYAQYMVSKPQYTYPIPSSLLDAQAAPMLCAGAIGYRSLRLANLQDRQNLGLAGFGASAHIVLKLAQFLYPNSKIFVFSRSPSEREFACELGAFWSGDFGETPPEKLNAVIDTTPAWLPVLTALETLSPGGRLVINAIRKETSDKALLTSLDYPKHLWMEKEIKSVANVSRTDVSRFLDLASRIPILPEFHEYPLQDANQALLELKNRKIRGAKVLKI